MKNKTLLMIPGPTPVPENVLLEMAKSPMPHRSPEFSAVFDEVNEDLKWIFQILIELQQCIGESLEETHHRILHTSYATVGMRMSLIIV